VAVEDDGQWQPRLKVTSNVAKTTDPAPKVLWRCRDAAGRPLGDIMALEDEELPGEGRVPGLERESMTRPCPVEGVASREPLLSLMMEDGRRLHEGEPLQQVRDRAQRQIAGLCDELKRLRNPEIYRVLLSPGLAQLKRRMISEARGLD